MSDSGPVNYAVQALLTLILVGMIAGCATPSASPAAADAGFAEAAVELAPHVLPSPTRLTIPTVTAVPTATPPPTKTAVPSPTATPTTNFLDAYTLDSLRARPPGGGTITIREKVAHHDTFAVYTIEYSSDDLTITGQMHTPHGDGPFPVIILLHGFMFRDQYQTGGDTWLAAQNFAGSGFLTIAPDLRSWGGSDNGPSLFHTGLVIDTLNLIDSLPSLPQADSARVGLWGHSMGGGIATKVLTVNDQVKTAVLYAPNSADDADLIARWGPGCLPNQTDLQFEDNRCNPGEILPPNLPAAVIREYLEIAADPQRLQAFAPYYHLDRVTAPVQIHIGTGDGDALVETPPEWSQKLADGLQAAEKDVTLFSYEGQGHFFSGESWEQFMARSVNFFKRTLTRKNE